MKIHYAQNEAVFHRDFIEWLLERFNSTHWPDAPTESTDPRTALIDRAIEGKTPPAPGYDIEYQHQKSQVMPNRSWIEVKAEARRRLNLCGLDGWICLLRISDDVDYDWLSKIFGYLPCEIERRVYRALNYISWGNKRPEEARTPRLGYDAWCFERRMQTAEARRVKLLLCIK